MDDYTRGLIEGQQRAIDAMSKEKECLECGGRAHGKVAHEIGFDAGHNAGVDACIQLITEGHFKGTDPVTQHNKQWLFKQLDALKK